MNHTTSIVCLATCYNRCDLTISSIKSLMSQNLSSDITLAIYIVDDGCTDDTVQKVKAQFPSVNIITSPGNLFWAGGMRYGFKNISSDVINGLDYLFVFNDDVKFSDSAIRNLLSYINTLSLNPSSTPFTVTGCFHSEQHSSVTNYGGKYSISSWDPLKFKTIQTDSCLLLADTINMNGALISNAALKQIGFLSEYFHHSLADYDFGLRLRKSGGFNLIHKDYIGVCASHALDFKARNPKLPLYLALQKSFSTKENPPLVRLRYCLNHGGPFALIIWLRPYLTIILKHTMNLFK